jgi:hypothetical protein
MSQQSKFQSVRTVAGAFFSGLGATVSVAGIADHHPFPGTCKGAAEALRSDWERLGGDMRSAVGKTLSPSGGETGARR